MSNCNRKGKGQWKSNANEIGFIKPKVKLIVIAKKFHAALSAALQKHENLRTRKKNEKLIKLASPP